MGNITRVEDYSEYGTLNGYTTYDSEVVDDPPEASSAAPTPASDIEVVEAKNPRREEMYDSNGNWYGYWLYYYDELGNERLEEYNKDGTLYEISYRDEAGNLTRQEKYNAGVLSEYWLNYYDGMGNVTRDELHTSDGAISEYTLYNYDDAGNLMREDKYFPDGTLSGVTYRNEAGYITRWETYNSNGALLESWDAPGNSST